VSSSSGLNTGAFEPDPIDLFFVKLHSENPRDGSLGLNWRELRYVVLDGSRERDSRTAQEIAMDDALEQVQYSPDDYPDDQSLREAIEEALSDVLVCQLITPNHLADNVHCSAGSLVTQPPCHS
jgi:hypothetical protein